jgi:hypothetical protein
MKFAKFAKFAGSMSTTLALNVGRISISDRRSLDFNFQPLSFLPALFLTFLSSVCCARQQIRQRHRMLLMQLLTQICHCSQYNVVMAVRCPRHSVGFYHLNLNNPCCTFHLELRKIFKPEYSTPSFTSYISFNSIRILKLAALFTLFNV